MSYDASNRLVLHLEDGVREVIDCDDVFLLEADGAQTIVHLGDASRRTDVRALGELFPQIRRCGLFRIHRSHAVSLARIRYIRRRDQGRDWEVTLQGPVERTLPVSREAFPRLMATLEHDE